MQSGVANGVPRQHEASTRSCLRADASRASGRMVCVYWRLIAAKRAELPSARAMQQARR